MPGLSKRSSQTAFDCTITGRLPSRTMLTSLTLSGNAKLLGKRTACERFDRKGLVRVMTTSPDSQAGDCSGYVHGILSTPLGFGARSPNFRRTTMGSSGAPLDAGRAAVYSLGYSDPNQLKSHQPHQGGRHEHRRFQTEASQRLAKKHHMLIDGKWVEAKSGKTFEVEDPATQEIIAHVPAGDKADIDLAVKAARKAFETGPWSRISPADRSRLVWNLGDLLEKHADEFAEIEALDNGKPVTNARRDDVGGSINMFRYMAGWSTRLVGETIPVSSPGNWHAYTLRQPVGVVGQIIPWNFPLMMAAWKLAPALAAGCTIVLKPAEQTPLSALRFGELLAEAGIP